MNGKDQALRVIEQAQAQPASVAQATLSNAIEEVVRITAATYTRESSTYAEVREGQPWKVDEYMTESLLRLVRTRIAEGELSTGPDGRWRLLDVGAGYGRDVLRFSKEPDIDAVALENAEGFVAALRALQDKGQLGDDAVVAADMRDMSLISDASFHCVRNHATLHHLPTVPYELGADAAVAEARRVLVVGGVFYVLVKAGTGISMIDTKEGLGGRFFQLFTPESLRSLIERHGFSMVSSEEFVEPRPSGDVDWIFALSVAS